MNPRQPPADASDEIAALIETLHRTGHRLEELTAGEVDSVADPDGRTFLLLGAQEQLRHSEAAKQAAILNALPANIALLDTQGVIVSANAAWRQFADANALQGPEYGIGVSYLEICDNARGDDADDAHRVAAGIRAVLTGAARSFSLEYPCHSPTEQRWFLMTVTPLTESHPHGAVVMHLNITERRQVAQDLCESERRFRDMLENVELISVMLDGEARITYCNDYLLQLTGWRRDEVIGQNWFELFVPPEINDLKGNVFAALLADRPEAWHHENEILMRSGERRLIRWNNTVLRSGAGDVIGTASVGEDITERRVAQDRIVQLNRLYAMLSGINTLIVRVRDRDELFREACRIAVEAGRFRMSLVCMVDRSTRQIVPVASAGKDEGLLIVIKRILSSSADAPSTMVALAIREKRAVVSNDSQSDPRVLFGDKYATAGVHSMAILPLIAADEAIGVLALYAGESGVFHKEEIDLLTELAGDIAFAVDHIGKEEKLNYLAYYDALTGLPNRSLFLDRVTQLLLGATRDGRTVAVILLDIDHFKRVNDRLGRHVGDALLKQVANRLTTALEEPCSIARIGVDIYAIAAGALPAGADSMTILQTRIFAALVPVFATVKGEVLLGARAGLALYPGDGDTAEVLLAHAEIALRHAKTSGVRHAYFDKDVNARIVAKLLLETELRLAVSQSQFVVYYQPKLSLHSGRIVGAEALIRWLHPERGLIGPTDFIPLAEECGLIGAIGEWVLRSVCEQQARWVADHVDVVPVAVNLSAAQFRSGNVVDLVRNALVAAGLYPRHLELELTESIVMHDPEGQIATLKALRQLGVGLALDDFGTGYSSLAYIKRYPFNSLKIDRAFITDITYNQEDAAVADAIVGIAKRLGMKTVAEGVETEEQMHYLRRHGCDEMQGYLFSRPVPPAEFEAMLSAGKCLMLPTAAQTDKNTLLLVDDEPNILLALQRVLRRDGYRVLTAGTGREGLDLLAVNEVQVIISDQRMVGMSGAEFLSVVKELYPDTIRIILSGYTDLNAVTDAVNRGAVFKFLTKPWDDDLLRENIRDAFHRYRPPGSGLGLVRVDAADDAIAP